MEKIKIQCDIVCRIDKLLHDYFQDRGYSRKRIKELIESKKVLVNGKNISKPSTKLKVGDIIEVFVEEEKGIEPVKGDLEIVYEDSDIIIVNKPPNLTTHPAPSCKETTLVNILIHRYPNLINLDMERPGIVHRLDKDTSGLIVIAKREDVQEKLKSMFKKREVKKKYIALVHGLLENEQGEINVFMDRDNITKTKMKVYRESGRKSITRYRVIKKFPSYNVSLIEADLITGRTHQIRVHFSYIGHPVLGDRLYGKDKKLLNPILKRLVKRQMLHAFKLDFHHPITNERLHFSVPVPLDFLRAILYVSKKRPMVVAITGGVGCGKSKVSEMLSKYGYPLWSADMAVEELYQKGQPGYEQIRLNFGDEYICSKKGCVNKKKLFKKMSQDDYFRQEVEKIIHPLVFIHMTNFLEKNRSKTMVILEIPLLVESGWARGELRDFFDVIVGIFCAEGIKIKRLKEIRGWNDEQIEKTSKWQVSQRERLNFCDIIIDNSYSLDELSKKVKALRDILRRIRIKKFYKEISKLEQMGIISKIKNKNSFA